MKCHVVMPLLAFLAQWPIPAYDETTVLWHEHFVRRLPDEKAENSPL